MYRDGAKYCGIIPAMFSYFLANFVSALALFPGTLQAFLCLQYGKARRV